MITQKDKDNVLSCIGLIVVAVGAVLISSIVSGFVISVLWGWFIAQTFHLLILTVPQAIGLTLVVRFIVRTQLDNDTEKDKPLSEKITDFIALSVGMPLMVLGIGYIIHLFV